MASVKKRMILDGVIHCSESVASLFTECAPAQVLSQIERSFRLDKVKGIVKRNQSTLTRNDFKLQKCGPL